MGKATKEFDARLANGRLSVFDFPALWSSTVTTRVPESQQLKMVG